MQGTDAHLSAILPEVTAVHNLNCNMAAPNVADDASLAAEPAQTSSNAITTPIAAAKEPKVPPPETKENLWLRRLSILSFWAVVVFLGLPIWLKTTAIYRAELPLQDMTDWAEGKVRLSSNPRASLT